VVDKTRNTAILVIKYNPHSKIEGYRIKPKITGKIINLSC